MTARAGTAKVGKAERVVTRAWLLMNRQILDGGLVSNEWVQQGRKAARRRQIQTASSFPSQPRAWSLAVRVTGHSQPRMGAGVVIRCQCCPHRRGMC